MKYRLLIIGLLLLAGQVCTANATHAAPVPDAVSTPALLELQESISQAVARVRPSVVSVKAQKKHADGGTTAGLWYESIGSGFVVDSRGYILTNRHVVDGAQTITVTLWQAHARPMPAHIVTADRALDLAVLKLNHALSPGNGLVTAALGSVDTLETGDWVMSVGSPFGFEHSVSFGIVSDLHRRIVIGGVTYRDMIQTDAVINQGNSGGPLIDIHGRIVGVGTAIYAPQGAYVGLGFAIPINRARHFFSRVTGAVPTALIPAAAAAKEPINLNAKMPGDKIHAKFSDCLKCHSITRKMVVSRKAALPHPAVGACDACHIMTNDKPVKGPTPVAATTAVNAPAGAINPPALETMPFGQLLLKVVLKVGLVTLVSSIVFTMLGVGGGFMYVPILLSCGVDFHTAATTSLVMLTFAQISALFTFFRSGLVDLKLVAVLELPTMIGAFLGGMLSHHFNVGLLSVMFACVLFMASYFMMQSRNSLSLAGAGGNLTGGPGVSRWEWRHEFKGRAISIDLMLATPLVFIVGYVGGMLGLAGGWLKVPIMVVLFNIPMKIAVATSSLMVPITGFAGFLGHSVVGHFDPRLAFSLSVITVIGAQIGSRLSIGTQSNLLRFIFAFVLSLVGLWMLIRII